MKWALVLLLACSSAPPAAPLHGDNIVVSGPSPNAPPDPIGPGLDDATACATQADCKDGEQCFAPDFTPGHGAPPECEDDSECRGGVCDGYRCGPRCTASSCGPGMQCTAAGHCEQRKCTDEKAAPCAQNHRCDAASGQCTRMACTDASACDHGTCWQGRCYAHGGFCANRSYCCPP